MKNIEEKIKILKNANKQINEIFVEAQEDFQERSEKLLNKIPTKKEIIDVGALIIFGRELQKIDEEIPELINYLENIEEEGIEWVKLIWVNMN